MISCDISAGLLCGFTGLNQAGSGSTCRLITGWVRAKRFLWFCVSMGPSFEILDGSSLGPGGTFLGLWVIFGPVTGSVKPSVLWYIISVNHDTHPIISFWLAATLCSNLGEGAGVGDTTGPTGFLWTYSRVSASFFWNSSSESWLRRFLLRRLQRQKQKNPIRFI